MLTIAAEHPFGAGNVGFATLETGFGSKTGASEDGNLWSRRPFVGVKNSTWGKQQSGKNLSIPNSVWDFDSRFSSENYRDTVPLAGKSQTTINVGFSHSF